MASNDLPPGRWASNPYNKADALLIPVYLVFQPIRFTLTLHHCNPAWALTPRFHPYLLEADGIFSVALAVPTVFSRRTFPLGSMALCVVLTFLILAVPECDRTGCHRNKSTQILISSC